MEKVLEVFFPLARKYDFIIIPTLTAVSTFIFSYIARVIAEQEHLQFLNFKALQAFNKYCNEIHWQLDDQVCGLNTLLATLKSGAVNIHIPVCITPPKWHPIKNDVADDVFDTQFRQMVMNYLDKVRRINDDVRDIVRGYEIFMNYLITQQQNQSVMAKALHDFWATMDAQIDSSDTSLLKHINRIEKETFDLQAECGLRVNADVPSIYRSLLKYREPLPDDWEELVALRSKELQEEKKPQ